MPIVPISSQSNKTQSNETVGIVEYGCENTR
jgi:hypothetical protein